MKQFVMMMSSSTVYIIKLIMPHYSSIKSQAHKGQETCTQVLVITQLIHFIVFVSLLLGWL